MCLLYNLKNSGSQEMFNVKLNVQQEFHSRHFSFPQNAITPQTGNTLLSQSAGAVWGDRHCPLRLLALASYFMSNYWNFTE